ncbi:hypothetical protein D9M69_466570 [compost metagenome]
MFIDLFQLTQCVLGRCNGIDAAHEICSVVDLVKVRLVLAPVRMDGDKSQYVIAINACFGPGGMSWEVSSVHGGLRQVRLRWADTHYGL